MKKERGKAAGIIARKRAVSPIVTTVLLVLIVLVLAMIILLWGMSFVPEALTKFDKPIETSCNDVRFTADYDSSGEQVLVVNTGNVPIYKFGVKLESASKAETQAFVVNLAPGATNNLQNINTAGLDSGDEIAVIPILLGRTDDSRVQEFPCPELNWKLIAYS